MQRLLSSLRSRLLFLVLLTILPALALTIYDGLEQRRLAAASARDEALRLTRLISTNQENIIEDTHQLLATLAQFLQVQEGYNAACNDLLAGFASQYPRYATIFLVGLQGEVICSSTPPTQPVNFADRSWFRQAIQTGEFAVGEYQIGRISGKAVIPLAYPILDPNAGVSSVLTVGLDLGWLNQLAIDVQLPAGSNITVIDRNGTILYRYPGYEVWVGKVASEAAIVQMILAKQAEGTAEASGVDGARSLYAFTPLGSEAGTNSLYMFVGIPAEQAFLAANRGLLRNISLLGFVFVISVSLAWLGSEVFLLRQMDELTGVTRRLAKGDLSARSVLSAEPGEVGQLAGAFNSMAKALEERELQIREAEANYRSLFNRVPVGLYRSTPEGRLLDANPALVELLGFPNYEALLSVNIAGLFVDPEHRDVEKALLSQNELVRGYELQLQRFDGSRIWVRDTVRTVMDAGGQVLYYEGNLEDITERRRAEAALRELATRDELTGLYNRREMMRLLEEEVERFQRHARPVSLAVLDIDHFKRINDAYGHPVGDEILKCFSQLLLTQMRSLDRPARYGGEEFALILPETDLSSAFHLAERIRETIAAQRFAISQNNGYQLELTLTVTIGVAEISPGIGTKEALIEAADRMLYQGKRQGRNCAVCIQDERNPAVLIHPANG